MIRRPPVPTRPDTLFPYPPLFRSLDLKRDIRFGTRVTAASWDATANLCTVETADGQRYSATWLITAVGCLSSANVPQIPGIETFQGDWYHTGQWPHDGVEFAGKRVGQIGTGSTGIQAVPVIAAQAAQLTVFQRTANYSIPARNAPLSAEFKHYVRENHQPLRELMQSTANGTAFTTANRSAHDVSDDERAATSAREWQKGGWQFRAPFRDPTGRARGGAEVGRTV